MSDDMSKSQVTDHINECKENLIVRLRELLPDTAYKIEVEFQYPFIAKPPYWSAVFPHPFRCIIGLEIDGKLYQAMADIGVWDVTGAYVEHELLEAVARIGELTEGTIEEMQS